MAHSQSFLRRNEDDIVRKYDITSRSYDELYLSEQYEKYHFIFIEKKIEPGNTVLDIGCGTALLYKYMVERELDVFRQYICLEPSIGMLYYARKKTINDQRVMLVSGYAENIPLIDCSVDTIFLFTVWDNIIDKSLAVSEIKRVLKPGGYVVLSTLGRVKSLDPQKFFGEELSFLGCRRDCFFLYIKK